MNRLELLFAAGRAGIDVADLDDAELGRTSSVFARLEIVFPSGSWWWRNELWTRSGGPNRDLVASAAVSSDQRAHFS